MINETMTVHQALSELKTLDRRIEKEISNNSFITSEKHSVTKLYGKTIEEYKNNSVAALDKITSLLNRRAAIRNALSISNASTKVEVNGKEYTIAEVIEMKKTGIFNYVNLLNTLSNQYDAALKNVERNNRDIESLADDYVKNTFSTKEKVTADEASKLRDIYIAARQYEIFTGIDINKKIQELSDWIDKFEAEVDSKISVSNALTTINIEY